MGDLEFFRISFISFITLKYEFFPMRDWNTDCGFFPTSIVLSHVLDVVNVIISFYL